MFPRLCLEKQPVFCYDSEEISIGWLSVRQRARILKQSGEDMNRKEDYIAVFDSGVGGISVLRHLVKLMPGERLLYYGDSANAPYGTRTREEVRKLSFRVVQKLLPRGIKALVVACNTATSAAICDLREAYPELIVIGIEPAIKLAADRFPEGTIGVLATPRTLREEKLSGLLSQYEDSRCRFHKIPAPDLVELVEAGKGNSPESEQMLSSLLAPYKGKLDALVLGCTHYPFASDALKKVLGPQVALLDGGEGTARETRRRLQEAGLLQNGQGSVEIENSSQNPELITLSRQLLYD